MESESDEEENIPEDLANVKRYLTSLIRPEFHLTVHCLGFSSRYFRCEDT